MSEGKAILRYLRISPRKVRLVADVVRGLPVNEAIATLQFTKKRGALPIAKLIKSAVVSAAQNSDADPDALYVKTIMVDKGPTLKRFMPRSMGRAARILKHSSHITVVVAEKL